MPAVHAAAQACVLPPLLCACHRALRVAALQGKRHQQNLAKRAAREAAEKQAAPAPQRRVQIKKTGVGAQHGFVASLVLPARGAFGLHPAQIVGKHGAVSAANATQAVSK